MNTRGAASAARSSAATRAGVSSASLFSAKPAPTTTSLCWSALRAPWVFPPACICTGTYAAAGCLPAAATGNPPVRRAPPARLPTERPYSMPRLSAACTPLSAVCVCHTGARAARPPLLSFQSRRRQAPPQTVHTVLACGAGSRPSAWSSCLVLVLGTRMWPIFRTHATLLHTAHPAPRSRPRCLRHQISATRVLDGLH